MKVTTTGGAMGLSASVTCTKCRRASVPRWTLPRSCPICGASHAWLSSGTSDKTSETSDAGPRRPLTRRTRG